MKEHLVRINLPRVSAQGRPEQLAITPLLELSLGMFLSRILMQNIQHFGTRQFKLSQVPKWRLWAHLAQVSQQLPICFAPY
jgi:hypothetical protein